MDITRQPPVVFVHGIRLSSAAWGEHIRRLHAANHRAIAVDLPGHGKRRGQPFTVDGATEAIYEGIDDVGGRALVVGHSLGGYMTIAAAARTPEKFAGLLIAGATAIPNRLFGLPFLAAHRLLLRLPDRGDRLSRSLLEKFAEPPLVDEMMQAGIATEVIPDVVREVTRFDVLAALRAYAGPVWFVNGRFDHFRAHERNFLATSANATRRVIPGAGHYLPASHTDAFAAIVKEAAATLTGTSTS
ncbi:alpha/beta fold hydrolase [Hoyosella altamirensis]|uniref:Pimeloyl-ACP methyl ester carboxylesterase n=1 Tax=Hoyosella altamirensis TaxID=616997 RepID=A0A839RJ45_9ACTN|nr:alpha/beta hydrolase [Hoyosella altamirensis]MBB3036852.1 pimeloyl-ACP methyl ester carboxylesterase [Hoyosella altamirensis]